VTALAGLGGCWNPAPTSSSNATPMGHGRTGCWSASAGLWTTRTTYPQSWTAYGGSDPDELDRTSPQDLVLPWLWPHVREGQRSRHRQNDLRLRHVVVARRSDVFAT